MLTVDAPIIEVTLTEAGYFNFKLRPCVADTTQYGAMLATLIRQIGGMFEAEAGFPADAVVGQIMGALVAEIERPNATASLARLN